MRAGRDAVFFKRRTRHIGRWMALVLVAALAVGALYTVYDNGRVAICTQRIRVDDLPQPLEGFTVLLLSDLSGERFGPEQKQLLTLIQNQRYDAVCIAGNMTGNAGDAYAFYELLHTLTTKPVFFIAGDNDPTPVGAQPSGYYSVLADWVAGAQTRGAVYLDAPVSIQVNGATVWFSDAAQIGLDLDSAQAAYAASGTSEAAYWLDVIERTRLAREQMQPEDLHIALSSPPLGRQSMQTLLSTAGEETQTLLQGLDAVLAGGTAGGQWRVPGLGPLWACGRWLPEEQDVSGLSYVANTPQYITGGLGVSAASPLPGFRLLNTPEIALITFSAQSGA